MSPPAVGGGHFPTTLLLPLALAVQGARLTQVFNLTREDVMFLFTEALSKQILWAAAPAGKAPSEAHRNGPETASPLNLLVDHWAGSGHKASTLSFHEGRTQKDTD